MKVFRRLKGITTIVCTLVMLLGMQTFIKANNEEAHWSAGMVKEWQGYGVINGYSDGTFKPNYEMTRAEFAAILSRVFGLEEIDSNLVFSDVKMGAWYEEVINKVVTADMMVGVTKERFNPSATITRQEVAVALTQAYLLTEQGEKSVYFKDQADIAPWAVQSIAILSSNGYISGRGDGKFDPQAKITRAEVLAMFDHLTTLFIHKAGIYNKDCMGNVIVNRQGITLRDMTIKGNLYLIQDEHLGKITLDNVQVKGNIYIIGKGREEILFKDVVATKPVQIRTKKSTALVVQGKPIDVVLGEKSIGTLTGEFRKVIMSGGSSLNLENAQLEQLTIVKEGHHHKAVLRVDKNSKIAEIVINEVTTITGKGKIGKLYANVAGIKSEIKPDKVIGQSIDGPSSGGGDDSGSIEDKYIEVSNITMEGVDVLGKGVSIQKNEITINMPKLQARLNKREITEVVAEIANLKEGDTVQLELYDRNLITSQMKSGKVTYTVWDFTGALASKKETIKGILSDYEVIAQAEAVAKDYFGKTIDEMLSQRQSIPYSRFIKGYEALIKDYRQEKSQDVIDLVNLLERKGMTLTNHQLLGKISIEAGDFETIEYTVKIIF